MTPNLAGDRVELVPLVPGAAAEMAPLLDDAALHRFIGGRPLTEPELLAHYTRLVAGAPGASGQTWFNWVIRRTDTGAAVGTTQITLSTEDAAIAWVVATSAQGHGFGTAAACAMVAWLAVTVDVPVVAYIHPDNIASERVAHKAGLRPTDGWEDGERIWRLL
ncbi:GNAT family N-acetyltransferase [Pseudonocardia sp. GCM10023141]|uniref:GNAT family N-acetyltransferase n=1 Tax=Pseudonocardia sp. GCM10023141 TaxID=3252653 RepID=UPI003608D9BC